MSRATSISRRASYRTSAICAKRSTSWSASARARSAASTSGETLSACARVASVRGGIRREGGTGHGSRRRGKLAVLRRQSQSRRRAVLRRRASRCDARATPFCLTLPPHGVAFGAMPTRMLLLVLHYDGTNFSGWQRQPDRRTVQGELETALSRLCAGPVAALGSGRTDAGVHARGQAVGVRVPERWRSGVRELRRALNAVLPSDVWV